MVYYRGQGLANYVVGVTVNNKSIVWRFRKSKNGTLSATFDADRVIAFIRDVCVPRLGAEFVHVPRLIEFDIDYATELHALQKYPIGHDVSVQPESQGNTGTDNKPRMRVCALQMPDVTALPGRIASTHSVIAIELKPKQPVMVAQWLGDTEPAPPYCVNCLHQMEKVLQGRYQDDYEFCPNDLFSGDPSRMSHALLSLFDNPHNHLKIFQNGLLVHAGEPSLRISRAQFEHAVASDGCVPIQHIMLMMASLFAGQTSLEYSGLAPDSIGKRLLNAQQLDRIGLLRALALSKIDPSQTSAEQAGLLTDYETAAAFKDCSVMLTVQLMHGDTPHTPDTPTFVLGPHRFAYSLSVIDLDTKSLNKLQPNADRLQTALQHVSKFKGDYARLHKPCQPIPN